MLRVYLIEDIESVVAALKKEGYGMVDHAELFRRLNPIEAAQQQRAVDGLSRPHYHEFADGVCWCGEKATSTYSRR